METAYQKKSVGVSNERFVAGRQNVAIALRFVLMAREHDADLQGSEPTQRRHCPGK